MSRRRRWILLPLAALAAILIVVLVLFDWNWLKSPLEGAVSAALEREFEVADLDVELGTSPTIALEQARIANAAWGSRPDMLTIQQVRFAIELWPLLKGEIRLPFLQIQQPDLLLETNQEGLANWKFGEQDQPEAPPVIPIVRDLEVADVVIRYREPGRPQDLVAALEAVDGAMTSSGVQLRADGTLDEEALSLRLASAPAEQLEPETEAERFPFELDARIGSTRLTATGSAEQPLDAQGLSAEIVLESEDSATLLALAGREARDLGALRLSLALTRHDQLWALQNIDAQLGESDLNGAASFSDEGEEPAISADLHSQLIRLADVQDVIEVLGDGSREAPGRPTVEATVAHAEAALESEARDGDPGADSALGLSPAMLPAIDAEVSYTIDRLTGRELALRDLEFRGRLQDQLPYVSLSGNGQYRGEPVTLDVQVGATAEASNTYPVHADVAAAGTTVKADGALTEPAELDGLQLRFDVASEHPGEVLALAGIEAREVPPLEVHGRLDQDGAAWQLSDLDGRLGASDIKGQATVKFRQPEPLVTADLASEQVRIEDLRPLLAAMGAQAGNTDPEAAIDTAIAEAKAALATDQQTTASGGFGLRRDMLPKIDAEVNYTVDRLSGPALALTDLDLHARLKDGLPRLELSGGGEYQNTPVTLAVQLGGTAQAADAAYPVEARLEAAATQVRIDGVIGEPATLEGLDLQVQASSENINDVLALADVSLPPIPPFAISGHVVQDGEVWRIDDFYGQFSESELSGQLTVDLSEQRPFITADLHSKRLLVSDLMAAGDKAEAIEERVDEEAPSEQETESAVISASGINLENLPEIDADVAFTGEFIDVQEFRFDGLSFDLKLRDEIAVLDASGGGQFRDGPLSFEAHAGNEQSLENPDAPYPIDLKMDSEETHMEVHGTVGQPGQLAGMAVDVALSGPNLDRLGEILQLSLPTTPPFDLQSHLTHDENRWNLTGLNGTIGDSDIQGVASIVLGGERPILEAELTSDRLDFDDLGLLVGAPADAGETVSVEQQRAAAEQAAKEGVLPDEPFDVPELRAMDARVLYRAKQVQAQKLPLEGMVLDLTLENGQLRFEPLRFDLADGELVSTIQLDGRTDVLAGDLELDVQRIRLNQLLSRFDIDIADIEVEQEGVGTLAGHAQLAVRGNSIKQLAGSADGKIVFLMRGGRISALILEAIGLDVGEALALLLSGDDEEQESEMVPIQCFVGRFDVQDGVMQAKALVLETPDSTITGKGQIDLGEETLSLELLAHPKDASALTASTPVRIEGTFKSPEIDLISEQLQEKSLAALALGVVLPVVGAIIPFFEEGETKDTNCARLIQAASAAVPSGSPAPQSD